MVVVLTRIETTPGSVCSCFSINHAQAAHETPSSDNVTSEWSSLLRTNSAWTSLLS
ncbi:Uncharacterised protein [Vibrio cholerae]|nr:Uncharacterised protein [Vibrio cholerae]